MMARMWRKRNPPKLLVGMVIGAATKNSMKVSKKETTNKTIVRLVNSTQI